VAPSLAYVRHFLLVGRCSFLEGSFGRRDGVLAMFALPFADGFVLLRLTLPLLLFSLE
jgi:hypothetical protein